MPRGSEKLGELFNGRLVTRVFDTQHHQVKYEVLCASGHSAVVWSSDLSRATCRQCSDWWKKTEARKLALAAGETRYLDPIRMTCGHNGLRFVSSRQCVECHSANLRGKKRKNNPEVRKRAVAKYLSKAENRAKHRIACSRRKLREAGTEGSHTAEQMLNKLNVQCGECLYCRKDITGSYTVDHIIPISKGGTDWIENIQLLCKSCNSRKHNKMPHVFLAEFVAEART